MKTSKVVLLIFVALIAFRCSTFENSELDKVASITDKEIGDLKKVFFDQAQLLDIKYLEQFKKYLTYQEFLANATLQEKEELIQDLNIQPIKDFSILQKIYNLNLSRTEFKQLEIRVGNVKLDNQNTRISSSCGNFCFDYKMGVYWDTFWSLQNAGVNMYAAHDGATIASIYAYNGCMVGCLQMSN